MLDFFRTGPADPRPARPLPGVDRAPDRPGHRRLLPGGARRAAPARRRPVARRPRGRHPLRRRALADRDGAPLPGAGARRRRVRAGLGRPGAGQRRGGGSRSDRIDDPPGGRGQARASRPSTTSPTSSTRSTSCRTRAGALRAAWDALRPGGRILVLDWPLPSTPDEFRTRHGELIAGVQLDELYQGTALATPRAASARGSRTAGLPEPVLIDLPSGATLLSSSGRSRLTGARRPGSPAGERRLRSS